MSYYSDVAIALTKHGKKAFDDIFKQDKDVERFTKQIYVYKTTTRDEALIYWRDVI